MTDSRPNETRWPNYCPFCGTHSRSGGAGNRHGVINCALCHADYSVQYYRAYPPSQQSACNRNFQKHGGKLVSESNRVYDRAYACVRFTGEALDPIDVTKLLRLPPDDTHRSGEPRFGRSRAGTVQEYPAWRTGYWSMSSEKRVHSPRLAMHIEWLLKELEPRHKEIATLLKQGIEGDFFCFSSATIDTAPSLPRSLRERAKAIGLPILIDHYGPGTGTGKITEVE